ncbi:lytic transglycosylase domain-containing protein [Nocardioides sp. R-C-SC26]|uniref:aggregation-promoting factor C-terminal-like domain-containing protein n=1 Tax=Nocardioides sp. R-C-SC26 TaxID=2870414 RepID=UPI001E29BC18|nr:lytic transglycosylase domain-containing protein [Nocardioides sp. R-C-SC26]
MSKPAPRHRAVPPRHRAARSPRPSRVAGVIGQAPAALRATVVVSSVAVAATGGTITTGLLTSAAPSSAAAGSMTSATPGGLDAAQAALLAVSDVARDQTVSRSADRRDDVDPLKAAALSAPSGPAVTGEENLSDADPRDIARALLGEFGFSLDQFSCLDSLYIRESNWNPRAANPTSSAYGIPQALPGSKMASAGADWQTNPVTQIRWGLGYIADRYGSPCGAWSHSQSNGWY